MLKLDADMKGECLVLLCNLHCELVYKAHSVTDREEIVDLMDMAYLIGNIEGHLLETDMINEDILGLLEAWAEELEMKGDNVAEVTTAMSIKWMQQMLVRKVRQEDLKGNSLETAVNALGDIVFQLEAKAERRRS